MRPIVCERVRAQTSLRLDGELSELERRMAEAHLARCPDCRAFAEDAEAVTALLRQAPPERPQRPVVVHRPRRPWTVRVQTGLAAAAALLLVGVSVQLAGSEPRRSPGVFRLEEPVRFQTSEEIAREVELIIAYQRAYDAHLEGEGPAFPL
ncbi:MAG TPA: zf-HC2 domain-containing protein [Gaiellaceae bacterium]|nr:zf-HC2 domain-containing protein [Gaiellaceae bacterium]